MEGVRPRPRRRGKWNGDSIHQPYPLQIRANPFRYFDHRTPEHTGGISSVRRIKTLSLRSPLCLRLPSDHGSSTDRHDRPYLPSTSLRINSTPTSLQVRRSPEPRRPHIHALAARPLLSLNLLLARFLPGRPTRSKSTRNIIFYTIPPSCRPRLTIYAVQPITPKLIPFLMSSSVL